MPATKNKKKKQQPVRFDLRAYLTVRVFGLAVAAGVIAVDAVTKLWALQTFGRGQLPIIIHEDIGALVLAFNRGMSFSMLTNQAYAPIILSVVAIVASAWFVHWLGESRAKLHQMGLGMILGGALGNLIDRLQHGAVVDFLLPLWKAEPWFPAFNVADSCISVGLVLILLNWFLDTRKPAKGEK